MIETVLTAETAGSDAGQAEYRLCPDVLFLLARDGTGRLLDLGGQFFALPAVGARMVQATLQHGPAVAAGHVAEQFGADIEEVRSDLDGLLHQLRQRGLLCKGEDTDRRRAGILSALILGSALRVVLLTRRSLRARARALLTLARLSFRVFGWTRTVAVWRRTFGSKAQESPTTQWEETAHAVDEAVRQAAASHLVGMECKERSLCCWALARLAGAPAALVLGINLYPLAGHCWCEAGPLTLSDDRERCARYFPVVRYL